MAENKTEEEILETDTVNEEASSAEEETKEAGNEASAGETEAKEAEEKADKKAEKKEMRLKKARDFSKRKKIRKTNRSKNFRIGSDARWQSLITSVRERKKKKPRCLKSELRVLSKRSFRS